VNARLAIRIVVPAVLLGLAAAAIAPGCSLPEGQGEVKGSLNIRDCWVGGYDLHPDFFAAVPYRDSLLIRVQKGGDYEAFSDGLSILVDNVHAVRGDAPFPSLLGSPLSVALSPENTPPGVPVQAIPSPAMIHAVLYLQQSCRTQNVALYALDNVTLAPDGTCDAPADGGADPPIPCDTTAGGAGAGDAGVDSGGDGGALGGGVGHSTMTFSSLFNGNPDEGDASQRFIDARFDLYLADPREICPGGLGPPPRCRGHLTGYYRFYFQRGKPAQPFP
jgi:hypothetical protein